MDAKRWALVSRLFLEAMDLPVEQRSEFLEAESDDVSVRDEVEAMLGAANDPTPLEIERIAEGYATRSPTEPGASGDRAGSRYRLRTGERVGPYVLKELIGQGGMSDVYSAERAGPDFQQVVAIKVLAVGLSGTEAIERFRSEGRILSSLNHPNIARMLDGGATADGVPYLVMEYVDGQPITEFCDHRQLSIEERLRLFRKVCAAVRYAHANLVVHRDLKPSNVLVTSEGEVRLLDFGIAKLLELDVDASSRALTRADVRLMTPEYAAPEQISGDPITTATDVYGLGLLLYELLSGRHPFRSPRTSHRGALEASALTAEPPSLATAVDSAEPSSQESQEDWRERVAISRGSDPRRLKKDLAGDLDTIVRKALHSDPRRRYESPAALSDDVDRYLRLHPIRARRDSVAYRSVRFAQRNRSLLSVTGVLGGGMIVLAASAIVQSRIAHAEHERAALEAQKAEQVSDFMISMFTSADPMSAGRDTLRVVQVLEEGAQRASTELAGQPAVQGVMLTAIGDAFRALGRREQSRELLREALQVLEGALGPEASEVLSAKRRLLSGLEADQMFEEAEALGWEYLAVAEPQLDPDDPELMFAQLSMSNVLHQMGQHVASDSLFDLWIRRAENSAVSDTSDFGQILATQGRRHWVRREYDAAETYLRRSLRMERAVHGDDHPAVGMALNSIVPTLWALDQFAEAETAARESVRIFRKAYPDGHRLLGSALVMQGQSMVGQDKLDGVEALYQEALDIYGRVERPGFPGLGEVYRRFGHLERERQRPLEAIPHYQRAVEVYSQEFGPDNLLTVEHRQHIAVAMMEGEQFEEAERILTEACETLAEHRGPDNQFTQECRWRTVTLYEAWGRPDQADRERARTTIPDRRAP